MTTEDEQVQFLMTAWRTATMGTLTDAEARPVVQRLRQQHGLRGQAARDHGLAYWENRVRYGVALGLAEWADFESLWPLLDRGAYRVGQLLPRVDHDRIECLLW